MATLQVDPNFAEITPAQGLTGRHREFCVQLLGDGGARVFVRAVEKSSFKAAELQRAILFHRLDSRFHDLEGCVGANRADLDCLVMRRGGAGPTRKICSHRLNTTAQRGNVCSKELIAGRSAESDLQSSAGIHLRWVCRSWTASRMALTEDRQSTAPGTRAC